MAIVFDGRAFAAKKEENLKVKVSKIKAKGITPRLASILIGDDPASRLYISLKKKAAERIGAEIVVQEFSSNISADKVVRTIEQYNNDDKIHGIMVQLPLLLALRPQTSVIIGSIRTEKDVDGLREDREFLHPTSKAVFQIIEEANSLLGRDFLTIAVVGESGTVGSSLVRKIKNSSLQLIKETNFADIVVSATGSPGIIKSDMIKEGAVVIDVGSPRGDVDPSVALRASFITPVPGGVGPVTISCLLENLIVSASKV